MEATVQALPTPSMIRPAFSRRRHVDLCRTAGASCRPGTA
ncbi:putative leader peptide [Rhodococcus sp. X156]